ncbi:MAG: GlsB/YeaQ/YmgE family stress response membrane protein [Microcystis aeruginosa L111-01]|nr:GlsB/YeaQ/YmgE family stress response membrane protein [Microcystis aeruginosa W13-18]NCR22259.1 GlsB/YeaQ/YmgE family stress response membrane protein [Microcystis aeruginosa L111-01]NCR36780.1 GlsB/YeaQ/YmgE family stress response membrane protein [Microcystis aeruginosa S11-05]NCR50280.1 GlsB/YeaQ/YmgE family stress response membrane protein [Microcystis aeruginosa S11-01]NCS43887.1 GlsB/YeaQ/YmgE family stress response membrane protein [Microcystis aeruginosa BS11-05]NCS52889.1 GlsB/Yea
MHVISWIILGFIAGAIAKAIYPGRQGGGILATTLLGIIGAFVGGTLLNLIQTGSFALAGSTLSIPGIFVAIIGAIVFIFLWGLVTTSRPD